LYESIPIRTVGALKAKNGPSPYVQSICSV
jgi:hypothetical protein